MSNQRRVSGEELLETLIESTKTHGEDYISGKAKFAVNPGVIRYLNQRLREHEQLKQTQKKHTGATYFNRAPAAEAFIKEFERLYAFLQSLETLSIEPTHRQTVEKSGEIDLTAFKHVKN